MTVQTEDSSDNNVDRQAVAFSLIQINTVSVLCSRFLCFHLDMQSAPVTFFVKRHHNLYFFNLIIIIIIIMWSLSVPSVL